MKQEIIKSELEVNDNKIKVITIDNKEFISLTDLARYANPEEPYCLFRFMGKIK